MTVRPISLRLFSNEPSGWRCDLCKRRVPFDHQCPKEKGK